MSDTAALVSAANNARRKGNSLKAKPASHQSQRSQQWPRRHSNQRFTKKMVLPRNKMVSFHMLLLT